VAAASRPARHQALELLGVEHAAVSTQAQLPDRIAYPNRRESSEEPLSNSGPFVVEHREIHHVPGSPGVREELPAKYAFLGRSERENRPARLFVERLRFQHDLLDPKDIERVREEQQLGFDIRACSLMGTGDPRRPDFQTPVSERDIHESSRPDHRAGALRHQHKAKTHPLVLVVKRARDIRPHVVQRRDHRWLQPPQLRIQTNRRQIRGMGRQKRLQPYDRAPTGLRE
jgi:hypothetical protein